MSVWLATGRLVPVAVVEGGEDQPLALARETRFRLEAAAGRLDSNEVTLGDPQMFGVGCCELDPHLRCGRVQLPGAAGLCAGVPVVGGAAGRVQERVVVTGLLVRRHVVTGLEDRPALG